MGEWVDFCISYVCLFDLVLVVFDVYVLLCDM